MAAAWAAIFVPFLAFRKPTVPCTEQEQGNFINPFQKLQSAMKTYIIKHCTNKTCSHSSKLQSTHTNRCLPFTPKHSSTLSQPRHPHIPVSSHCMLILMKLSEMVYCSIVTLWIDTRMRLVSDTRMRLVSNWSPQSVTLGQLEKMHISKLSSHHICLPFLKLNPQHKCKSRTKHTQIQIFEELIPPIFELNLHN